MEGAGRAGGGRGGQRREGPRAGGEGGGGENGGGGGRRRVRTSSPLPPPPSLSLPPPPAAAGAPRSSSLRPSDRVHRATHATCTCTCLYVTRFLFLPSLLQASWSFLPLNASAETLASSGNSRLKWKLSPRVETRPSFTPRQGRVKQEPRAVAVNGPGRGCRRSVRDYEVVRTVQADAELVQETDISIFLGGRGKIALSLASPSLAR